MEVETLVDHADPSDRDKSGHGVLQEVDHEDPIYQANLVGVADHLVFWEVMKVEWLWFLLDLEWLFGNRSRSVQVQENHVVETCLYEQALEGYTRTDPL